MRSFRPRRRGFTLVELLTVVSVIGLLATIAIPGYVRMTMKAREVERTMHLATLRRTLVNLWRVSEFKLPPSTDCTTLIPNDPTYASVPFKTGIVAGTTNASCWGQIPWGIDGGTRVRFKYVSGVQSTPRPNSAFFEITAYADSDRDGKSSYIQIHCVPDERQECVAGVSFMTQGGADTDEVTPGVQPIL